MGKWWEEVLVLLTIPADYCIPLCPLPLLGLADLGCHGSCGFYRFAPAKKMLMQRSISWPKRLFMRYVFVGWFLHVIPMFGAAWGQRGSVSLYDSAYKFVATYPAVLPWPRWAWPWDSRPYAVPLRPLRQRRKVWQCRKCRIQLLTDDSCVMCSGHAGNYDLPSVTLTE